MRQEYYDGAQIKAILKKIDRLLETGQEPVILAIDGSSGSGKTTFAGWLSERYDCNLYHMDDFFLQKEQRTKERYAQPGGNVDYERFRDEVLKAVIEKRDCFYRKFDCSVFELGKPEKIPWKRFNIVEGAYSQHPFFGDCYQMRIFLTLSAAEQRRRILARDPGKAERFFKEWIPMENSYFDAFDIRGKSLCLDLSRRISSWGEDKGDGEIKKD